MIKYLQYLTGITLMLLFSNVSYAQALISIKVVDAASEQPIHQVFISMGATNYLTDEYGNATLKTNAESIEVTAIAIGYKTISTTLVKNKLNIVSMTKDVANLKEVTLLSTVNSSTFSTLNKIDLNLNPVKSSQELLRLAPGLFVAQHAGGGKAEQIFLRGFDVDHGTDVSVNVDGMPVNMVSHAHGQGYADAHFIIAETVNNVDFGAGPYYANYGNFTTAGYINMSTFQNIDKSRIQIEAGRFNTFRTLLMLDLLKKNKGKQSAYIAADFNYSDGPTQSKQVFRRFNLFGKYNLAITDHTQLTASASAFASDWYASGQIPQRAVKEGIITRFGSIDPTEGGNTERYNANVVLRHQFNSQLKLQSQLFYSRYLFNLYSNFTFFANDPINGDGIQQTEARDLFGFTTNLSQQKNMGTWQYKATYATGIRYDATQNSRLNTQVQRTFLADIKLGNITEANLYAFAQQQFSNKKWAFDVALRADYFNAAYNDKLSSAQLPSRDASILSPKLNIQYTANKQLQLYVKSGRGFHSNDSRVVVANNGREILPAALGTDVGVILKPTSKLFLNIAAWYLHLEQEFVYVGDAGIVEPSGATSRKGIDLAVRYQFSNKLFANLNINYTKAIAIGEAKGENFIPLAPDLTSIGGLYYKSLTGFNGGISYRYIKDRAANEDNSIVAEGYFVVDAVLNYTKKKYEVGFSIENMLNTEWNEAQFATESRLRNEPAIVNELHFTPGNPFFARVKFALFF
jgi:outer membrane cobalamin receptor